MASLANQKGTPWFMSLNMVAGGSSKISHDAYIVDMHPESIEVSSHAESPQALNKQRQAPHEGPKNDQIQVGEGFSCTTYNGYIYIYIANHFPLRFVEPF
jgi:hypothetical protein